VKDPNQSVYHTDKLSKYYPHVQFGINCAIVNPSVVKLGNNVVMGHSSSIFTAYKDKTSVIIGQGTQIGSYNAFSALDNITIGEFVLFGPYVHISDHSHRYDDISKPIMHQGVYSKGPITIGNGCWFGFGSHVLSGVKIGKNSIIGANSVVTNDIPDYCIATGSPAKAIKRYNHKTGIWENDNNRKFFYLIDRIKELFR
jgi:acetyltransferase-like isoleucine patch superfamily enzyme